MANLTVQICNMMYKQEHIRNISVIAHVDHGKTTLSDSLVAKAGIISPELAGSKRVLDVGDDEKDRGITIKSTSISLYYERDEIIEEEKENKVEKVPYLINLIDSPGHVDFSSEVTAALRVTDGALVVVDCVEGVCVQTETVLRQAINERVRPVLWLNKIDRIFSELQLSLEECYTNLRKSIESVNVICQTYEDEKLGNLELTPENGKVGFGSGLMAWGFTIQQFAKMYCSKFGLSEKKMISKLWGEHYWNPKEKKWITTSKYNDGKKEIILERGFNQFVLLPIYTLFNSINNNKIDIYEPIIHSLRLKISKNELEKAQTPKNILKLVMRNWLPAGNALLDLIVDHLPSPVEAQKYRIDHLYTGPLDSEEAEALRRCDPNGILAMYVSKMVPYENGRFIAFGRVFSGTMKTGQEVRILGANYEYGKNEDFGIKKIQKTYLMMGKGAKQINECPAGNVCGLMGIDDVLLKSGTITTSKNFYPIRTMKFSVSAIVQVAVEPKNVSELPKLIEGLKSLSKSDPLVKCMTNKQGQHIIAGAGELHLEICLSDLQKEFMNGSEIIQSKPIVSFCETISMKTGEDDKYPITCISKSPNKLNRLYCNSSPLDEKFINSIESGKIKLSDEMKKFGRMLANDYNWNAEEASRIWSFGCPPDSICNVIVDLTKGVQYLKECKDSIITGFYEVTNSGILCDEPMRGARFNIEDVKIHSDPSHRGQGQIIPCARSVFYACQIASGPRLMEPIYSIDITVSNQAINGVYSCLNQRRGQVERIIDCPEMASAKIEGFLPVLESFGFVELLRKNTGGKAFAQMKFSHWKNVSGDPMIENTPAYQIMMDVRKRKGIKLEIPNFDDYHVKLP